MIPREFIDEVLARTDVVEIIEPRVSLKKSGQNYSGLCPFHNEKTPSFSVSQNKQFYYCFGCQASGNAIDFLIEFDRMDFVSAVEYLAQRAGLEVPENRSEDAAASKKRKSLHEILEQSSAYYREQLKSHEARERAVSYLKGRGVSGEIARDFSLGFAPPGWDNLMKKLGTSNFDRQLLIESGMITENKEEEKVYDRFRDRIMFPIKDLRGRTIAFGGRVLSDDAKPKYLNSPETSVFHKGRELYGLYEARKRARLERIVVVEGYMDVVALAQHGIGYSVATLGTATSTEHVERLFRLVPQIVFCFDGDAAGRNAAWKALKVTLPAMEDGRSAKFLFVPEGDDPDSLVRREGKEKFEARIESAPGLTEFFFSSLEADLDMDALEGRAALSKLAVPLIREVPEGVFRQLVIDELSQRTGLESDRLLSATGLDKKREAASRGGLPEQRDLKCSKLVEHAVTILFRQPELALSIDDDQLKRLSREVEWQLLSELVNRAKDMAHPSGALLLSRYQDSPYFEYLRSLAERDPMLETEKLAGEFAGTIHTLIEQLDHQQKQRVIDELTRRPLAELTESEKEALVAHTKSRS